MSDKRTEKVEGAAFADCNTQNFHARWADVDFGIVNGLPITTEAFEDASAARDWFALNFMFLGSLWQRMARFMAVAESQGWNCCVQSKDVQSKDDNKVL